MAPRYNGGLAKSGVPGLDHILGGGFPRGYSYAIIGGPGSGKTTLGLQFLYEGATRYGENGIYVTFQEPLSSIITNAQTYGWNLERARGEGKIVFLDFSPKGKQAFLKPEIASLSGGLDYVGDRLDSVIEAIADAKNKINASRCVLDSISALTLQYSTEFDVRRHTLVHLAALTELGLTSMVLVGRFDEGSDIKTFGVEAFYAHGVVVLNVTRKGSRRAQFLEIKKLRGLKHSRDLYPYAFTQTGLAVNLEEFKPPDFEEQQDVLR